VEAGEEGWSWGEGAFLRVAAGGGVEGGVILPADLDGDLDGDLDWDLDWDFDGDLEGEVSCFCSPPLSFCSTAILILCTR